MAVRACLLVVDEGYRERSRAARGSFRPARRTPSWSDALGQRDRGRPVTKHGRPWGDGRHATTTLSTGRLVTASRTRDPRPVRGAPTGPSWCSRISLELARRGTGAAPRRGRPPWRVRALGPARRPRRRRPPRPGAGEAPRQLGHTRRWRRDPR